MMPTQMSVGRDQIEFAGRSYRLISDDFDPGPDERLRVDYLYDVRSADGSIVRVRIAESGCATEDGVLVRVTDLGRDWVLAAEPM